MGKRATHLSTNVQDMAFLRRAAACTTAAFRVVSMSTPWSPGKESSAGLVHFLEKEDSARLCAGQDPKKEGR